MIVSKARITDIKNIVPIVEEFVNESGWGWKFNVENTVQTLANYIINTDTCVLIVHDDEKVNGFACIAYEADYQDEVIGYVSKFYINKDARGTSAGRELVQKCVEWFDENNCKDSFATATANIAGQEKLFENLLGKFGYKPTGETLVRSK